MEIFHIHLLVPKISRYVSFNTREILYECSCGKKELRMITKPFDEAFPIETTNFLTRDEMLVMLKK